MRLRNWERDTQTNRVSGRYTKRDTQRKTKERKLGASARETEGDSKKPRQRKRKAEVIRGREK